MKRLANEAQLSVTKASAGIGLLAACLVAVSCSNSNTQSATTAAEADQKARQEVDDRLSTATESVKDFRSNTPDRVAERPRCVAMVPNMVKAGFVVGGNGGKGFAVCKTDHGWSPPAPISIGGGSVGLQAGANSSDWLMLVMSDRAQRALLNGNFKVGVDASATAGPTGAGAGQDIGTGDTVSYSRSRGLFAGAVLNGATISQDDDATRTLYGKDAPLREILGGREPMPADPAATRFVATVRRSYSGPRTASGDIAPAGTASDEEPASQ